MEKINFSTAVRNLKKNFLLLLSTGAALCLFLSPSLSSLITVGLVFIAVSFAASYDLTRPSTIPQRYEQIIAVLIALLATFMGYETFFVTWISSSKVATLAVRWGMTTPMLLTAVGLVGCAAGFYAMLTLARWIVNISCSPFNMKTFKQEKFSFTKEHTAVAKGIAILAMFYHHLFVIEERIHCDYIPLLKFAGHDWQTPLAYFCRICVGIYVFLSGLGLYYSTQRVPADRNMGKTWLAILKKLCSFYLNYWIIFLLFVPLGFLVTEREFDITSFLTAFFGLTTGDYNGEWWFVQAYLILLLLFPLLAWFVRPSKPVMWLVKGILAVALITGWHIFETADLENQGLLIVRRMIAMAWLWIPAFLVGILCAKFDVYSRMRYFLYKRHIKPKLVCLLVLLVVFVVRVCITRSPVDAQLDYLLAPLFVFAFTTLLIGTRLSPLFQLLGKHSMNMWLTHTFWCYYYFQPIVFLPKISVLVFIWLTVLSLLTSWVINLINDPLQKLLKSAFSRLQTKTREIQSDSVHSSV